MDFGGETLLLKSRASATASEEPAEKLPASEF